jgi:hypothetical protein
MQLPTEFMVHKIAKAIFHAENKLQVDFGKDSQM